MHHEDQRADPAKTASPQVALADIVSLAVEHWRLSTWMETARENVGIARHAIRRIADLLSKWQVEVRSLDGRPFDAGLAARVIDTVDDPSIPAGIDIVDETVSPLVLWRGTVVRPAEIVVRRGTGKKNAV